MDPTDEEREEKRRNGQAKDGENGSVAAQRGDAETMKMEGLPLTENRKNATLIAVHTHSWLLFIQSTPSGDRPTRLRDRV